MSPELAVSRIEDEVSLGTVFDALSTIAGRVDGVTISGGEPFDQASELLELVSWIETNISDDIICYTGKPIEELREDDTSRAVLNHLAVLIDGPYLQELDDGRGIRGSTNQTVHLLGNARPFDYEGVERTSQAFVFDDHIFMAGLR